MSGPEQPYQPPEYPASSSWQQPPQYPAGPQYPGPPQYPAPEAPYSQYGQPQKTNGFAIASLVLGILGPCGLVIGLILAIVFGFIGLSQTKDGREKGRGMAIAGLVCSGLWIVGLIGSVVLMVIFDHSVRATDVKAGDCIESTPSDNARVTTLPKVSCDKPHQGEVYAVMPVSGDKFPGEAALRSQFHQPCLSALESYAPGAVDDNTIDVFVLYPSQETWDHGDRDVACMAITNDKRTGSLKK
jgi:hypothetical protein